MNGAEGHGGCHWFPMKHKREPPFTTDHAWHLPSAIMVSGVNISQRRLLFEFMDFLHSDSLWWFVQLRDETSRRVVTDLGLPEKGAKTMKPKHDLNAANRFSCNCWSLLGFAFATQLLIEVRRTPWEHSKLFDCMFHDKLQWDVPCFRGKPIEIMTAVLSLRVFFYFVVNC